MPSDDEVLTRSSAIVTGTIEGSYVRQLDATIVTAYQLRVSQNYKGPFNTNDQIEIVSPGGHIPGVGGTIVHGAAHFAQGDHVLLFLTRTRHGWTPTDLTLGKFRFVTSTTGERLLVRDEEDVVGWNHAGRVHHERVRREEGFLRFIEERVNGRRAAADYVVDASTVTLPSERLRMATDSYSAGSYTRVITCSVANGCSPAITHGSRWATMASGVSFVRRGAIGGAADGGVSVIQNAMSAWNSDCGSGVSLSYSGTTSASPQDLDGVNVVAFNDPSGTVPGSWTGSGTIAVTSISYGGEHTALGDSWWTITSADVVFQDGYTASEPSFPTAMAHELGHAIGFRHSNATPATADGQTVNCNSAAEDCTATNSSVMFWEVNPTFGSTLQPWDVSAARSVYPATCGHVKGDMNADGRADVMWRRDTGENSLWLIQPGLQVTVAPVGATDSPWKIVSSGDYNGDGRTDLLWRHFGNFADYIWFFDANNVSSVYYGVADSTWSVLGSGDFDGNGVDDIFWRRNDGVTSVWMMFPGSMQVRTYGVADPSWIAAGFGDVTGDGKTDIIWRQLSTGLMSMWVVTGDTMSAVGMSPVDASWTLAAVGDFNGDGKADLFWRHTSGQNFQWQINGSSINAIPMPPADPPYQVAGCGDFTGDGKADLLWRHDVYGWNWVWQIDGGLINPTQLPSAPDTTWRVQSPK